MLVCLVGWWRSKPLDLVVLQQRLNLAEAEAIRLLVALAALDQQRDAAAVAVIRLRKHKTRQDKTRQDKTRHLCSLRISDHHASRCPEPVLTNGRVFFQIRKRRSGAKNDVSFRFVSSSHRVEHVDRVVIWLARARQPDLVRQTRL
eukprot:COSAG06_NODE_31071_length_527_cov_1.172897_1_plen_145_part_01